MKFASAPGKVILFGEHAVVYPCKEFPDTKPHYGIAAAVNKRAKVRAKRIPEYGIRVVQMNGTEKKVFEADFSMRTVVRGILDCYNVDGGIEIEINSEVPRGSHLGSSSAVFAAAAAAVLLECEEKITPKIVSYFARLGDKVIVGTPSGIDDTTVSYGGWIKYVKESAAKGTPMPLDMKREIKFVVGSTGICSDTGKVVGKMKRKIFVDSSLLNYLDKINEICDAGEEALRNNDMRGLGEAMNANHEILKMLGVSHEKLDDICKIAFSAGAYGAKMTGAGWGGCAIAVADEPEKIVNALVAAGYEAFVAELGCEGVREEKNL